jgi:hypothetical protein
MRLTLDTWQRVQLLATVQGTPAKIGSVRAGLQLLDIIDFSDDEAKSIGLVTNAGNYFWTDDKKKWELEVPDDLVPVLKEFVQQREVWPVDRRVKGLFEQLGLW